MQFNKHYNLQGCHAIFSASQSSWVRYDDQKALEVYTNKKAAEKGTRIHAWAAEAIELGFKQPRTKKTVASYINDAIGFRMTPEVVLYYSDRFFGTADAISFRENILRIHDLKTGTVGKIENHIEQLMVYAALFCLEYRVKPGEIKIELRVYKNDDILVYNPTADEIAPIMDKIIHLDKLLEKIEEEV